MVTRLGWDFLCRKMLIMGITNEEAARRKKEKEEKEKKKKMKERKAVIATQKREAKQRKMVYPFLIFLLFFCLCPFLRSDIAARAEGPTGPPSEERG